MTDAKARLLQMIADEPHMGGGGLLKAVGKAQKVAKAKKAAEKVAKTVERVAAPQAEAMRLAQQRAALPIAQGGLGLPANNTPAQRATAMGFDADVYHGSKQDFNKFKDDQPIFAAEDPEIARLYGSFIYPLKLRGKVLEISDLGKDGAINRFPNNLAKELNIPRKELKDLRVPEQQFNDSSFLDKLEYLFNKRFGDPQFSDIGEREMVNKLPRYGIDRLKVTDMSDMGGTQTQHMIPAGSENIRSRFAAFDPFRRNAATAAAMGVAAPDLLADEKKATGGAVHMAGGGKPKPTAEELAAMRAKQFNIKEQIMLGNPNQFTKDRANQLYPKKETMNPIVKVAKDKLDQFNAFIDRGVPVKELVGGLTGAIPFVGPKLREDLEGATVDFPLGFERLPGNEQVATGNIETAPAKVSDILDNLKMSDLTGGTGASNVLNSVGKGYMPDPLDLLDAATLAIPAYAVTKAGVKGAGALSNLAKSDTGYKLAQKALDYLPGVQPMYAVKPKGGNWVDTEVKRQLNNLKNDEDYSPLLVNSSKQDLAEIEKNPSAYLNSAQQIEILRRDIANMEQTNAFNKWVDSKAGSYVRNQMGTPDDPVVKSIDMRVMKAQADLEAGQKRLAALDGRIAEAEKTAVTPDELNQLAGMKRNRSQRAAELQSNYDLTLETMLPGGKSNQGYSYLGNHNYYLDAKRKEAGFPVEGYGQTRPGKAWEALTDANISTNPAKIFQNHEKKLAALKQVEDEYKNYRNVELKDKFRDFVNSQPNLADSTRRALIDGSSTAHMAGMVGDTERHEKLLDDVYKAQRKVNNSSMDAALDNPYLAKLPPEAPVYMLPGISELGIDHVIDVLKQDVAAGNIKLEDLNKITMEQALKRASEYDLDLAKKARDSVGASRAAMPVYKEYPEGYRWVQLTKPGEFRQESEEMGHSVKGYEPPKGHEDWSPTSENSGDANYGHGGWEAIKSGQAKVYSLVDANHKPHVTIEVKQNPADKGFRGDEMPHGNDFYTQHNKYLDGQRSGELSPNIGFAEWWRSTQGIPEPEASPPIITQIKGKGNARPAAKYDQYTQDFVRSGNWGRVERDLKNTGLIESNGRYFTEPEFAEAAKKYGRVGMENVSWDVARQRHLDLGISEEEALENWLDAIREGRGRLDIPDEPRMAGGGLLKALIKAQKTAKAVKAAESAMQNFTDIATPVISSGTRKFDVPAAKTSVIKETGGNWISGNVEQAMKPLRKKTAVGSEPSEVLNELTNKYTPETMSRLSSNLQDFVNESIIEVKQGSAINDWIDRNLTNYVKKQMATPNDPVRKLAEEGILHIPVNPQDALDPMRNGFLQNSFKGSSYRSQYGGQQLGQADLAKDWENAADAAIQPISVQTIKKVKDSNGLGAHMYEPWMDKADPNTSVHMAGSNFDAQDLGFNHIVDVLNQDLAAGRIRPEQLNKISMEQAVRRTYEFDQDMAKKMRETQAKVTEGMPVYKEYPEGYKWVELSQPKDLPKGWSQEPSGAYIGPKGERTIVNPNYETLEQALRYEGDKMGHCVGGYCQDVAKGSSRIYSLRDAKGEPHVTIETSTEKHPIGYSLSIKKQNAEGDFPATFDYNLLGDSGYPPPNEKQKQAILSRARDLFIGNNPNIDMMGAFQNAADEVLGKFPESIIQIKGKQNRAPKEDYLPFVQDFVKSGNWSDVGDLRNTGLKPYKGNDGIKYVTPEEYEIELRKELGITPPEPGMAEGGDVKSFFEEKSAKQRLLDMIAEEPHMAGGGEVHMGIGGVPGAINKAQTAAKAAKKAAEAAAKAAKVVPAPAAPAFIPGLMQKSTATEIGREERARRQAAAAAEAARVAAAKQTPVPVGYVKHTEKSPNPHVGYRYEATQHPGIAQPIPIDLAKLEREKKGASLGVMPWDSQSRNVEVSSISGEPLQTNLYTHAGQPYSLDEKHLAKLIGGASAEEVADAIKTRDMFAVKENRERGGTGEVVHAVTTMGQYGENYSHPPSDFAFEIINRRLQEGKLSAKDLQALNNSIRTFQDKKKQVEQGIFPYANFAGFETPEGLQQIYTGGLGLNTSSGNLRKAIAAKLHKVGTQELLGFNSEDLINATTVPSLRGVDKGYLGGTLLSNDIGNAGFYGPRKDRFGMELAPAEGFPYNSPYNTDFSARYYGQLPDLVPLDVVMHRQLAPIEQGLLARENKKPYTAKSLRNSAIGSLEKSNEGVSQIMDARFFQDLADYFDALNKPLEKKKGGLAHTKKVKRHGNTVSN